MTDTPEKRAIISGIGISRTGRRTGIPGLEMTLESSRQAIADAGLTSADIDGVATMGETPLEDVVKALGIDPPYRGGGFRTGGLLSPAMSAFIAAGTQKARHILVYRTVSMMTGSLVTPAGEGPRRPPPDTTDEMLDMSYMLPFHAYAATNWLGMHCMRHMHLYGTKKEQLGWLAVNSRKNAALNPAALYKDPFTLDDYMNARMISTPFNVLDCDIPMDGSVALVVSTADYAKDCPKPALHVEAIGGATGEGGWFRRADYPKMASKDAAEEMWSRTDLKPKDIDIAQLYDGFTFLAFDWLEALGICKTGESGPFVEGGKRIALDGALPLNTYGGQLSAGRLHGYWVMHEACVQLRGEGGARQVKKAPQVCAVGVGGGTFGGCVLLTR